MDKERIIGEYEGQNKGPLLICFGGIHGNEPAGVRALELIFKMLEVEPITNPNFVFNGKIVGLVGNLKALKEDLRFIDKDLNRMWTAEHIISARQSPKDRLTNEALELRELLDLIDEIILEYRPPQIYFLDLHTTTAHGGIFSLVTDQQESIRIGKALHAPVVLGMMQGIKGTTMHYFNREIMGVPSVGVVFESGQHRQALSVNRAIAAVINYMRSVGCISEDVVENVHDELLIEYGQNLPKVVQHRYTHHIDPSKDFHMVEGFANFDPVTEGQIIAHDLNGAIKAPMSGLILMPLYQKRGEDGFFIVDPVVD